jgi:hypothetical protein
MNKLITNFNNGLSFRTDDIRWFGEGFEAALNAFMSSFGATAPLSYKLSGCVVTKVSNDYTTTAGYIVLNGEVLKVDAHTTTASALHTVKWAVEITYDASGDKLDDQGGTHQCYQVRKGVLVDYTAAYPPVHMPYNANYLSDVIAGYFPTEENWHEIGDTGEPAFTNSWVNYGGTESICRFKQDVDGWVCLDGYVKSGADGTVIFTLPTHLFPATTKRFVCYQGNITTAGYITINTAGEVIYNSSVSASGVSLSGIRFRLE